MNQIHSYLLSTLLVAGAFAATGCCKSQADADDNQEPAAPVAPANKPVNAAAKGTSTTPTPTPTTTAPTTTAPKAANTDPNRPGRGLDGLPAVIPPPTSKVPSIAEWNAAPWEITVAASSPLGCETKMVREWLRVSCRDKNKWGGKILGVSVTSKGGVQAYDYYRKGVASLVVQVVRNRRHESVFTWSDRKARLIVDWTPGHQRPKIALEYL